MRVPRGGPLVEAIGGDGARGERDQNAVIISTGVSVKAKDRGAHLNL